MSYRRSDIKYRRNEAFVDVIENVNHLMSATGQDPFPNLSLPHSFIVPIPESVAVLSYPSITF